MGGGVAGKPPPSGELARERRLRERLGTVLEQTAAVLETERYQEAATAFVTLMASQLACDRVSLGFRRRHQFKVEAVSHAAQIRPDLRLVRAIGEAMDEALDQFRTVIYPEPPGEEGRITQAHQRLALFLALAQGDHRVSATVVIEGSVQRAVTAPFAGYISEAPVRAGDTAEEHQVLCRLDDRDLKVERQKWLAQKQQALLRYREALAEGDVARMHQPREQQPQAEAQLALIEEQLARVVIRAPFKGLVVQGDLSQSLGAPVERGQVLFEVAPLEDYRVKLLVPDSDMAYVQPGQKGEMVLASLAGESFPLVVDKVTPVTTVKEGRSVFQVEAGLEQSPERLRPGMEGYAKLLVCVAVLLTFRHWQELTADLMDRVLGAHNLVLLWLLFPLLKALHELGHGYAIKAWAVRSRRWASCCWCSRPSRMWTPPRPGLSGKNGSGCWLGAPA